MLTPEDLSKIRAIVREEINLALTTEPGRLASPVSISSEPRPANGPLRWCERSARVGAQGTT
jgi:hypothetical protein